MAHAPGIKIYRKRKVVAYDDLSHRNTGDPCARAKAHRRQYDTRAPSRRTTSHQATDRIDVLRDFPKICVK